MPLAELPELAFFEVQGAAVDDAQIDELTCPCLTKQVASTHCREDAGRVYANDYPDRR